MVLYFSINVRTVGEGVITNIVAGRIGENEEDHNLAGSLGSSCDGPLLCNGPAAVYDEERNHTCEIHLTPGKSSYEKRKNGGIEAIPAVLSDVEPALKGCVRIANAVENSAEVIRNQCIPTPLGKQAKE